MKSRTRLLWIKLHTYFSCFFLPLAVLFLTTGVLHYFHIEGGTRSHTEYRVALPEGWPKGEEETYALVTPNLKKHPQSKLPPDFYLEDGYAGWFGYRRDIHLEPTDDPNKAVMRVKEHDLLEQLMLIHKGYAGPVFWVGGILFAASLLFSLVSGLVVALAVPIFRKTSIFFTLFGLATLILVFFFG